MILELFGSSSDSVYQRRNIMLINSVFQSCLFVNNLIIPFELGRVLNFSNLM